ncbi:LuxR C-terminal-related transcriptional regulator [Echinicola jeungdonensis]|uniref:Response regulator transcription factor n=1 Tax=Echinicola jeungdonensis TaxID=709343 RepID=A0ABV5J397_9BACT|nr:LuxR C-terminal-related transcriptional regulator [Echinicola jeungdonensis]MDN3668531.1 LuxR C-terminal-related transcriptional regulator [Echinicola jeungdonensis]
MIHRRLDQLIGELKQKRIIYKDQLDYEELADHCNQVNDLITLHDIGNYRPIFINEVTRKFYGFNHQFLRGMDYLYYLKTIHPSYYPTLFRSLTFFNKNQKGFLDLTYKLKAADGSWKIMVGSTKTITRTKDNQPLHALTLMLPEEGVDQFPQSPMLKLESLTKRELEIFSLLTEGQSVANISEELFISEETVKKHKKNIFQKLDCNKTQELIKMAFELGVKF